MNRLIEDLSTITTISQGTLSSLNDKAISCICHSVYESVLETDSLTKLDIGIGILYIKCEGSEIKYKFIPSKKLEESVASTIVSKKSPLVYQVETSLKERVESTYKNLL